MAQRCRAYVGVSLPRGRSRDRPFGEFIGRAIPACRAIPAGNNPHARGTPTFPARANISSSIARPTDTDLPNLPLALPSAKLGDNRNQRNDP